MIANANLNIISNLFRCAVCVTLVEPPYTLVATGVIPLPSPRFLLLTSFAYTFDLGALRVMAYWA
jgi:hypothetical protein